MEVIAAIHECGAQLALPTTVMQVDQSTIIRNTLLNMKEEQEHHQQEEAEQHLQVEPKEQQQKQRLTSIVQRTRPSQDAMMASMYEVIQLLSSNNNRSRNSEDVNRTIVNSLQPSNEYSSFVEASIINVPLVEVQATASTTSSGSPYADRYDSISTSFLLPNSSIIGSTNLIETTISSTQKPHVQSSDDDNNNLPNDVITIDDESAYDSLRGGISQPRFDAITIVDISSVEPNASTAEASSLSFNSTITSVSRDTRSYPWIQQTSIIETNTSTAADEEIDSTGVITESRPMAADETIRMRHINVPDNAKPDNTISSGDDVWYDSDLTKGKRINARRYFDNKVVIFEKTDRSLVQLNYDGSIALTRNSSTTLNRTVGRGGGERGEESSGSRKTNTTTASTTSQSTQPIATNMNKNMYRSSNDSSIIDSYIGSPSSSDDRVVTEECTEASAFWDNENILKPPQNVANSANRPSSSIYNSLVSIDSPISSPISSDDDLLSSTNSPSMIHDMIVSSSSSSSSLSSSPPSLSSSPPSISSSLSIDILYDPEVMSITSTIDQNKSISDGTDRCAMNDDAAADDDLQ